MGIPGLYPVYGDSHTLPGGHGKKYGGMVQIDCALPESFSAGWKVGE